METLAAVAVVIAVVAAILGALEIYLLRREVAGLREDRRRLEYEVMAVSVRLEEERERSARRRQRWQDAAREAAAMKRGVEEALDVINAYRLAGATVPVCVVGLDSVRDGLSDFGRLAADEMGGPSDLAEVTGIKAA